MSWRYRRNRCSRISRSSRCSRYSRKSRRNLLKTLQQHWLEKRTELIVTYNDFYDSYYQVLDEGYYKELKEYTLPTITSNIFTESEKQIYINDFNLFFTDDNNYITNYKNNIDTIIGMIINKINNEGGNTSTLREEKTVFLLGEDES